MSFIRTTEPEIKAIAGCPIKLAEIRKRLSSISWWMRLLCQRVAQRANQEDQETGRFFQDRFKATRLTDEASLLACSAYVDLNPIRAAICLTLEQSDHTSVQRRIESLREEPKASAADELPPVDRAAEQPIEKLRHRRDSFLSLLTIGRARHPRGCRRSWRGWGLDRVLWRELVSDFGKLFGTVAGNRECVDSMRSHRTHRRFHLRHRARELFSICD